MCPIGKTSDWFQTGLTMWADDSNLRIDEGWFHLLLIVDESSRFYCVRSQPVASKFLLNPSVYNSFNSHIGMFHNGPVSVIKNNRPQKSVEGIWCLSFLCPMGDSSESFNLPK